MPEGDNFNEMLKTVSHNGNTVKVINNSANKKNTINTFKGVLNKNGGIAKLHQFEVTIIPSQGLIEKMKTWQRTNGPSSAIINDLTDNDSLESLSFLCCDAKLPGNQITTEDWSPFGRRIKMPTGIVMEDLELEFILTSNYRAKFFLDAWVESIYKKDKHQVEYRDEISAEIRVDVYSSTNWQLVSQYLFTECIPIGAPGLDLTYSTSTDVHKVRGSFNYTTYTKLSDGPSYNQSSIEEETTTERNVNYYQSL